MSLFCRTNVHRLSAQALPIARLLRSALLSSLVLGIASSGCKSVDYKAASMPAHLHVAPAPPANQLNLAGITGPGLGTSRIGPGDLLELTILSGHGREEIVPFNVRVSPEGHVPLPLIGLVPVAGLEPFQAEQQIVAAAVEREIYRQPTVTVQVVEPAVNRVTVLGAVTSPGVHELRRGSSDLVNALAAAGGLTEKAGTKVDILRQGSASYVASADDMVGTDSRGGVVLAAYAGEPSSPPIFGSPLVAGLPRGNAAPQTIRLDLAQLESTPEPNYSLGDRDVVMVLPDDPRFIHVTGLVLKPDQFELPKYQDVRLLDAIAMAGGVSSPVADKAFVIRRLSNMAEPAVIQVSIRKAKRDGNENLRLAPGDLVSVETTAATAMVDTVRSLFRMSVGLGGNLVAF